MLSFIAICILATVSGHSKSRSHSGSHSHEHHGHHDMNKHHGGHDHGHHNSHSHSHSHSHSSENHGTSNGKRQRVHKCSDDHHKIKKGENLHQFDIPYDNHPYAKSAVKITDIIDEIPSDFKDIMDPIFGDKLEHEPEYQEPRSLLTDAAADPIRISAHYDSSVNSLSTANQNYLKKTISASINYYEQFVQVIPVSGTWFFDRCSTWWTTNGYRKCASYQTTSYCQNSPVPSDHYGDLKQYDGQSSYTLIPGGNGIDDTDLVLYVSYYSTSSCSNGALAHAGPCAYDQYGRPVAGNINVCSSFFQSTEWKGDVQTMLHEMTHITIMVSNLWDDFKDPTTGETLDFYDDVYQYDPNIKAPVIKSPKVKQLAQDHFGCTTNILKGMPLTNYSSHWHMKWLNGETLTPTSYGDNNMYSKFTLGLMEDSGWYYVDYEYAQPFYHLEGEGCGVISQTCINTANENPRFDDFCNGNSDNGCTPDYLAPASCYTRSNHNNIPTEFQYFTDTSFGGPDEADYCPLRIAWDYANVCSNTNANTRCGIRTSSSSQYGQCYVHNCISWNNANSQYGGVEIEGVSGQTITCLQGEGGTTKTLTGVDNFICPYVDRICGNAQDNGFGQCIFGHYSSDNTMCICDPGYTGTNCTTEDDSIGNLVQLASSREPTGAPTAAPSSICVSGFGSYDSTFNTEWNYVQIYNGLGAYKHPTKNRHIWWNDFQSEWYLTGNLGSSGSYCKAFGGSEYTPEVGDANGNWGCWDGSSYASVNPSAINYGDCTAIPTVPVITCDSIDYFSFVWTGLNRFRERQQGQGYLDDGIIEFFNANPQCAGDGSTLEYYYDFSFKKRLKQLTLELYACCSSSTSATFDDSYTAPDDFAAVNTGDAFIDDDLDIDLEDGLGTKEIVVFVIVGSLVLICLIVTIFIGKRVYDKRSKNADAVELTHKNNRIKNTPTPVADRETDGNNFPNTTR